MRFSQRMGFKEVRTVLQIEEMDVNLKTRIWNIFLQYMVGLDDAIKSESKAPLHVIINEIWQEYFVLELDKVPYDVKYGTVNASAFFNKMKDNILNESGWEEVYDFIEFMVMMDLKYLNKGLREKFNEALVKEVAGYRIIGDKVTQITSEQEILEIAEVIDMDDWKPVTIHLKSALHYLSERKSPDYGNSIKECISAVEAACKIITGDDKASLGKALSQIERKHQIDASLKKAFDMIYGYTSNSGGIRHGRGDKDIEPTFAEAKFMIVACSAFINYLKAKI